MNCRHYSSTHININKPTYNPIQSIHLLSLIITHKLTSNQSINQSLNNHHTHMQLLINQSLDINRMYTKWKRPTPIYFLKLPWTTIKPIKLVNLLWKYLQRRLLSVDTHHPVVTTLQYVYPLYHLTRVLLKQKYKKLTLVVVQNVYQLLSLSTVQLPRQACVGESVCH